MTTITFYKINTNYSRDSNARSLADIINLLDLKSGIVIAKENAQFHTPFHHLARVSAIAELAGFNRNVGFTRKIFDAILLSNFCSNGFSTHHPEEWLSQHNLFEEWLEKGIIAAV